MAGDLSDIISYHRYANADEQKMHKWMPNSRATRYA